jgi:hypothetical protein
MAEATLRKLAQDLEWLGCELEYLGHKHALAGFPEAGPTWDSFRASQRGVLATTAKIERELKNFVRFNPTPLFGLEYPITQSLNCITDLLASVGTIKQAASFAVADLPPLVRQFTKRVEGYLETVARTGG